MRAEEIRKRKRRILQDALRRARGDRRRAARALGFSLRALERLLKSLDLDVNPSSRASAPGAAR